MNTTGRFLSLILAACAVAQVQAEDDLRPQAQRAPGSGQLLREVHQQQLSRTLSDRLQPLQPREPDTLYQVLDGGVSLPPGLCERTARGCQPGGPSR
jgi:hypothetical protein